MPRKTNNDTCHFLKKVLCCVFVLYPLSSHLGAMFAKLALLFWSDWKSLNNEDNPKKLHLIACLKLLFDPISHFWRLRPFLWASFAVMFSKQYFQGCKTHAWSSQGWLSWGAWEEISCMKNLLKMRLSLYLMNYKHLRKNEHFCTKDLLYKKKSSIEMISYEAEY